MSEHWSGRPEGGGRFALSLIRFVSLHAGRGFVRPFLPLIVAYFYLRRPFERRVSASFLARVLPKPPSPWQVLRHIHRFASTILDRVFLLTNRFDGFDVRLHGHDALYASIRPDRGVLLLGSHLGSFEVLRVSATARPEVKVRAVLDTQQTPAMTELLHALNPDIARNVIDASGSPTEVVLALGAAIHEGALTALLADRARPGEATVDIEFLGEPAPFPTAPFLIASVLKAPVVLCFGLYRGGNRYDVYFEPFAERLDIPRRDRDAALKAAVQRYAARLEHHVRQDPYNWFNWHDFWKHDSTSRRDVRAAAGRDDARRAA